VRAVPLIIATGSSISYFADRNPRGGPAVVRIDDQDYVNINVSSGSTELQTQQLIWKFPNLDGDDHQIVIANNDPNGAILGLDYFEYVSILIITAKRPDKLEIC
jgi:hypothetical protein